MLSASCSRSSRGGGDRQTLTAGDSVYIRSSFSRAEHFMGVNQYDSAQVWLNRIHEKISYRRPSFFSYLLTARQAEVYYYNNLHQLGLQEAQRAAGIAERLQDDVLKADAYNFCGLFCISKKRMPEAIAYFKKGIAISRQPPYPEYYGELTNPHHLYGNISEAYDHTRQYDSALYYGRLSYQAAVDVRSARGMASALLNIGTLFLNNRIPDSAFVYFGATKQPAIQAGASDILLNTYSGQAVSAWQMGRRAQARALLDSGFAILTQYPQLNSYYTLLFAEQAIKVYRDMADYEKLAQTLALKSDIQSETHSKNNQQYLTVLTNGLKNETQILNMEVAKARQQEELAMNRMYLTALVFLLLAAAFVVYRYFVRQKLRLANLRNKISQDLHDEVGATLSGIALYSYITRQQHRNRQHEDAERSLGIIEKNATTMVKKLNDIVWTVNPVHDSLDSLLSRLEDFAIETAAPKNISVAVTRQGNVSATKLTMDERKNIYLICKEAVNNAIKYSACREIRIGVLLVKDTLHIEISDDGTGFDVPGAHQGNGIRNIYNRAEEIQARVLVKSVAGAGTTVALACEITQ